MTELPRWNPIWTRELADGLNGNFGERLAVMRRRLIDGEDIETVCRFSRKIARTAFSLVMPRWQGWTSDFDVMAAAFTACYPQRSSDISRVIELARKPSSDRRVVLAMFDGFGAWLRDEFESVIKQNSPEWNGIE